MRDSAYYIGKPIESLQTMLRMISEIDPSVLPVIPSGQYGGSTYASVRSFQESNDLSSTGSTDLQTWNKVTEAYENALLYRSIPAVRPAWSSDQTVRPGESNRHLYLVQAMLAALSHSFPELVPPALTGTLDPLTRNGLRWVQKASNLPQSGTLDTATWNQLTALYRTVVGDGNL